MPFVKGSQEPSGSGRKPGAQTACPAPGSERLVLRPLKNQEGGADGYLSRQAIEEPRAFMALLGKLLRAQITGEDGDPVRITQIELVPACSGCCCHQE